MIIDFNAISCVYRIQCVINGKLYIGKTHTGPYRLYIHRKALLRKEHAINDMQNDFNLHGIENFLFEILHNGLTEEEATKIEIETIRASSFDDLYNTVYKTNIDSKDIKFPEYRGLIETDDWLSISEFAKKTNTSPQRLHFHVLKGSLKSIKVFGLYLIHRDCLNSWPPKKRDRPNLTTNLEGTEP